MSLAITLTITADLFFIIWLSEPNSNHLTAKVKPYDYLQSQKPAGDPQTLSMDDWIYEKE